MPYVLDIALVLILAVCVLIGIKRGCAKMLVRVVGTLLAVVVASSLSGQVAGAVFDGWLSESIQTAVSEKLPELSVGNLSSTVEEALNELPDFLVEFAQQQEVDIQAFADQIQQQAEGNSAQLKETVAATLTQQVVRPMAVALLTVICFLLLLLVLLIAVHFLAGVVDKLFKLPLLGTLNKTLGGVLGALQGVLWVAIAVTVIQLIACSSGSDGLMSAEVLEKTVLTKHLIAINPFSSVINEVSVQANTLLG